MPRELLVTGAQGWSHFPRLYLRPVLKQRQFAATKQGCWRKGKAAGSLTVPIPEPGVSLKLSKNRLYDLGESAMSLPLCQEGHEASLVPELLLKLEGLLGIA